MGIGVGILLLAVGAILAFAVHTTVSGVSLVTVGIILMVVGAVGLIVDLAVFAPRRSTRSVDERVLRDPGSGNPDGTVLERRVRDRSTY